MKLTVLGADGSWPSPGGAASGYLLDHEGYHVWIDMGTGTMANLQRHVGLYEVDAVVVSHVHADHLVDLFTYFYSRNYGPPEPPPSIPLVVPQGAIAHIMAMLSGSGAEDLVRRFDVDEMVPGDERDLGPFRLRTAGMAHPVPTLGMRFEANGSAFAYSADTGECDPYVTLARGADLALTEATWLDDGAEYPPDIHLTAREAGEHAARAQAGRLVLCHINPMRDADRSRQDAAEAFGGPVEVARVGAAWEIG